MSLEFTVWTCFFVILLRASVSMNTNINISTPGTITIVTMTPSASPELSGGVVTKGVG